MKRDTIFTIGLLISFFLPWLDFKLFMISGYNTPQYLKKLSDFAEIVIGNNDSSDLTLYYLIYSIPLICVFNMIKELSGNKGTFFLLQYIIVASCLICPLTILANYPVSSLTFGFYLTLTFVVLGIYFYFKSEKSENQNAKTPTTIQESKGIEASLYKKDLLTQLDQLYSLKEKNIITEEIYDDERNAILVKLQKQSTTNIDNNSTENEHLTSQAISWEGQYPQSFHTINDDNGQTMEDWFKSNPGKSINDYYKLFQKRST